MVWLYKRQTDMKNKSNKLCINALLQIFTIKRAKKKNVKRRLRMGICICQACGKSIEAFPFHSAKTKKTNKYKQQNEQANKQISQQAIL